MKADIFDYKAKPTKQSVELPEKIFGLKPNDTLLAQYVRVFLSNLRSSIAHTKRRGEVSGGGRKPWKQKGTGRARAGSNRSPIWRKGGVVFGPRKDRNWTLAIPKQMKVVAIRSAFSKLYAAGNIAVVAPFEVPETGLAKSVAAVKEAFAARKLTLVSGKYSPELVKAFANVQGAKAVLVSDLNAYDVLNAGKMLLDTDAVEFIKSTWS